MYKPSFPLAQLCNWHTLLLLLVTIISMANLITYFADGIRSDGTKIAQLKFESWLGTTTVDIPHRWYPQPELRESCSIARNTAPDADLCTVCRSFGAYIQSRLQDGKWQESMTAALAPIFNMGHLGEIFVTRKCALCRLVSKALSDCSTDIPLVYETVNGRFRQECGLVRADLATMLQL